MERKHVLIIAVLRNPSGNFTTATRIRDYFLEGDFNCTLRDANSFKSLNEFTEFVIVENVTLVLGLHAVHTGKYLQACPVPIVLVFGGTDLNVFGCYPDSKRSMTKTVTKAKFLVAFSEEMMNAAFNLWPELRRDGDRTRIIKQGVLTHPSKYDVQEVVRKRCLSGRFPCASDGASSLHIFTLIAGIRPVKDPLFLANTFSEWHQCCCPNAYLVIAGPIMDEVFGRHFLDCIKGLSGVIYLGGLEVSDAHAAVKRSLALVNSSLSEGNSVAILEAMDMGVPVIVRDIDGNKALVQDGRNGLLYTTPQEFIRKAEMLIQERALREKLIENGSAMVKDMHRPDTERDSYLGLAK